MRNFSEHFLKKAKDKHGDKYDFSKVVYKDYYTNVIVICPIHGEFEKTPSAILNTTGCNKCAKADIIKANSGTTEKFIQKSVQIHKNKYDYSNVNYINNHTKVSIGCPFHGNFEQTPQNHLVGNGCQKCSFEKIADRFKSNTDTFISKAKILHGDNYNYDKVAYIKNNINVTITCPTHGDFEQQPSNHLLKKGCYHCARDRIKKYNSENPSGWNNTTWAKSAENSKNFDSFKLYLIECWDETERFFKIGKTYRKIKKRFHANSQNMPYNYKVLFEIQDSSPKFITSLEADFKCKYKEIKYKPLKFFRGQEECFSTLLVITEVANSLAQLRIGSTLCVTQLN